MAANTSSVVYSLRADVERLRGDLARAKAAMQRHKSDMTGIGGQISGALTSSLGGAAIVAGAFAFGRAQYELAKRIEGVNLALKSVTATTEDYRRAKLMLSVTAYKTGRGLLDLTESYKNFTAAVKGSKVEGAVADKMFRDLSKAAGIMGLSVEQTQGAFKAFEQMLSKGTVQSEELRGQLSERLPGAFRILARSMGVTTKELGDLLKQGKVISEDVLPKFTEELLKTYGAMDAGVVDNLTASQTRLTNAWTEMIESMGQKAGLIKNIFSGLGNVLIMIRGYNQDLLTFKEFMTGLPSDNAAKVLAKDVQNLADAQKAATQEAKLMQTAFEQFKKSGLTIEDLEQKLNDLQTAQEKANKESRSSGNIFDASKIIKVNIPLIDKMIEQFRQFAEQGKKVNDEMLELMGAPGTLKRLNYELKQLEEKRLNVQAKDIAAIDEKIKALKITIEDFGRVLPKAIGDVEGKGLTESLFPVVDLKERAKEYLDTQKAILAESIKVTKDAVIQMSDAERAFASAIIDMGTGIVVSFAESLAFGDIKKFFDSLMGILGEGMSNLGRSLIAIGIAEKIAASGFNPGAKIAAGTALVFLGARFSKAGAQLSKNVESGRGGGYGGSQSFGSDRTGQSLTVNITGQARGRDLAYVIQNNSNKDLRAKANF